MRLLFVVVLAALAPTAKAQFRRGPRLVAVALARPFGSFGARGVGADPPTANEQPSGTPPADADAPNGDAHTSPVRVTSPVPTTRRTAERGPLAVRQSVRHIAWTPWQDDGAVTPPVVARRASTPISPEKRDEMAKLAVLLSAGGTPHCTASCSPSTPIAD